MTSTKRLAFPFVILLLTVPVGLAHASPSDSPSEDGLVAHAVRARLAQPDAAETIRIDRVAVDDGVAVLTGTVRTRFALAEAVRVTEKIPGVRAVNTHGLRVEPNP